MNRVLVIRKISAIKEKECIKVLALIKKIIILFNVIKGKNTIFYALLYIVILTINCLKSFLNRFFGLHQLLEKRKSVVVN